MVVLEGKIVEQPQSGFELLLWLGLRGASSEARGTSQGSSREEVAMFHALCDR